MPILDPMRTTIKGAMTDAGPSWQPVHGVTVVNAAVVTHVPVTGASNGGGLIATDAPTNSSMFIAVTDAEVWEVVGRQVFTAPFINVNRDQIQIIAPESH